MRKGSSLVSIGSRADPVEAAVIADTRVVGTLGWARAVTTGLAVVSELGEVDSRSEDEEAEEIEEDSSAVVKVAETAVVKVTETTVDSGVDEADEADTVEVAAPTIVAPSRAILAGIGWLTSNFK